LSSHHIYHLLHDVGYISRHQRKKKKTANGRGDEPATNASEENLRPVTRRQTSRNQQQETTPEERTESQYEGSSETQDEVPGRQQNTHSQSEAALLLWHLFSSNSSST